MSGDVSTQDLTQSPETILVNLINLENLIYLPTALTVEKATFNDPISYGGDGANSMIVVGTTDPATYGAGQVNMYYTRVDLSKLAANQPALTMDAPKVSDVIAALNATYNLNLAAGNITQSMTAAVTENEDGSFTQQITTAGSDRLYMGTQIFTFAKELPVVTAAFTSSVDHLDVTFTDTSTDQHGSIAAWLWDFGDSAGTSTDQNPTYTYSAAGTYNVKLTVTDADGTTTSNVSHSVTATAAPVVTANFTHTATYLDASFTDTSTDINGTIATWAWDFGDGNSATTQNATHTYGSAGTYSVKLTVTDTDGTSTNSKTQSITVAAEPVLAANFTSSVSGRAVTFTDTSTDTGGTIGSWAWDFGDGTGTSTAQNPSYTYSADGTFSVKLTVTDTNGSSANDTTKSVTVAAAVLASSFTYEATGLEVAFTDTSTATGGSIGSWLWDFGDGEGTSTEQNPTYTFASAGDYTVQLTVTDSTGQVNNQSSQTVTVSGA